MNALRWRRRFKCGRRLDQLLGARADCSLIIRSTGSRGWLGGGGAGDMKDGTADQARLAGCAWGRWQAGYFMLIGAGDSFNRRSSTCNSLC